MNTLAIGLACWLIAATAAALLLGAMIRTADRREQPRRIDGDGAW